MFIRKEHMQALTGSLLKEIVKKHLYLEELTISADKTVNGQINTGTKQSNGFVKVSDRDGIRREILLNHSQGISNLLKDVTMLHVTAMKIFKLS